MPATLALRRLRPEDFKIGGHFGSEFKAIVGSTTRPSQKQKTRKSGKEKGRDTSKCSTTSSLNKCGSLAGSSNLGPKMSHLKKKKALSTLTPTLPYRTCVNLQLSTQHWSRENQQWGSALLLDKYMSLNEGFTFSVGWSPILKTEIRIRLVLSSGLEKRQNELSTQARNLCIGLANTRRWRYEDLEFKINLDCKRKPCFKKIKLT